MGRVSIAGAVFVAALSLGGCAATPAVMSGYQDAPSQIGLTLVDARPAIDKTSEIGSFLVTSCDYGIYRLGDERTVPSKLDLLRRDLESALSNRLANKTVTVSRYLMYANARASLRRTVNGSFGGVVPTMLASAGEGCTAGETDGGWFESSEVVQRPDGALTVIVIDVAVTVDGKDYAARVAVQSSGKALWGSDATTELFDAMHRVNAQLIDKIRGS